MSLLLKDGSQKRYKLIWRKVIISNMFVDGHYRGSELATRSRVRKYTGSTSKMATSLALQSSHSSRVISLILLTSPLWQLGFHPAFLPSLVVAHLHACFVSVLAIKCTAMYVWQRNLRFLPWDSL